MLCHVERHRDVGPGRRKGRCSDAKRGSRSVPRTAVLRSAWLGLSLIAAGGCAPTDGDVPAVTGSPTPPGRIEVTDDPRVGNYDARIVSVVAAAGDTGSLVSRAFNSGVLQVGVNGKKTSIGERLRLCNLLVDEFRDTEDVRQILVTSVPVDASPSDDSTEPAPPARWDAPDVACGADPD